MKLQLPFARPSENDVIVKARIKKTIGLLSNQVLQAPFLDVGERSLATECLEVAYGSVYSTTDSDFNYYVKTTTAKKFNTIFCLEVLEHLVNPLSFLNSLKDLLTMTGRLILTTPTRKPVIESNHFTEYTKNSLQVLFNYADWNICYYQVFRAFPASFYFSGIRPLFYRLPFHKWHLFILTRKYGNYSSVWD